MSDKILTISIAAYNVEKYLQKCLNSFVLTKVFDKLEILVVNDGSTDNTKAIADEYHAKYPNTIKLIDKENGGHGSTINCSIKEATAKYYKIVDADDWVEKSGIEKLVFYLEKSDCDLVLNPYLEVDALSGNISKIVKPCENNIPFGKEFIFENQAGIMLYMHSLTFKTDVLKKMGPVIDEHCFYVDMEYALLPMEYVKTAMSLDFPVYEYLLGTATQSMAMDILVKRREQHLKVTKRLVEFYVDNANKLKGNKKKLFCERIKYAVYNQYKIYYYMASEQGKRELIDFDKWMKAESMEIYKGPVGRFMKIVKFDRMTGWNVWYLNIKLIKKFGMAVKA